MNNLQVIEQNGQRVLTTQQLAEKYGTDSRTISNNFNRNLDRYKKGEHYFALEGEAKRAFINRFKLNDRLRRASSMYLWTERGAIMHYNTLRGAPSDGLKKVADYYGFSVDELAFLIPSSREFIFGEEIVRNLFSGYTVVPQFRVLNYRLDWYIPELNLAIEFDESGHINRTELDAFRQAQIEKHLGCRFLRYTDYPSNVKEGVS